MKKAKMAGDGGLNALSLLPENVLPQWQQKIALRAENTLRPFHYNWDRRIFCAFVQFSAGIGPAHFPAETTRPLRPRLSAIFTFFYISYLFAKWQWELRRKVELHVELEHYVVILFHSEFDGVVDGFVIFAQLVSGNGVESLTTFLHHVCFSVQLGLHQ